MSKFSQALLSWYKKNARDLPWRKTRDPYKIWISEIMLQQTTVATVIPRFDQWVTQFPSIKEVASASEQEILKAWQGLGYYARARNIKKTAEIVCQNHAAKLPADPLLLAKLPGFGPYTTGAVSSIAFNLPEPIVDANVRRVMMRLKAIQGKSSTEYDENFRIFLKKHLTTQNANQFNQALMELGALICKPNNPLCAICPLKRFCLAYKKGIQELIPQKEKKQIKNISVALAVIKRNKKIFIQRRTEKGLLNGMWEFPGGKIEHGESALDALYREVKEEVGCDLTRADFFMRTNHFYTQFRVDIHAFICEVKSTIPSAPDRKWVSLTDILKNYPMPSGSAKILARLEDSLTTA